MRNKQKLLLSLICIYLFLSIFSTSATAADDKKRVLVLHSYHYEFAWTQNVMKGIKSTLNNDLDILIDIEYMDTKKVYDTEYLAYLNDLFKYKYKNNNYDVLICSDNNALNFLLLYGEEIFPGTPVVFCGINGMEPEFFKNKGNYTGVLEENDFQGTLETALRLHPDTRFVAFFVDSTTTGNILKQEIKQMEVDYKDRITFLYKENLTFKEAKMFFQSLPQESIVILIPFFTDAKGELVPVQESTKYLSKLNKVPIYSCWEYYLDFGIVGGKITRGFKQGEKAGQIALRILQGENISNISIENNSAQFMFDKNQLTRFGIDSVFLPKDSTLINKRSYFYDIPRTYLFISFALILFYMVFLIYILNKNIQEKKKITKMFFEEKQKSESMIDLLPLAVLFLNKKGLIIDANEYAAGLLGSSSKEKLLGKGIWNLLTVVPGYEKKSKQINDLYQNKKNSDFFEVDFIRNDGKSLYLDVCSDETFLDEKKCLMILLKDIAERKRTQQLEKNVLEKERQLINAMEYNRIQTEFFANLSHELRTPLNVLLSSLQILEKNNFYDNEHKIMKYRKMMKQNCYRLLKLVNNLIDITKINSGYFEISLKNCDIVNLVEDIALSVADYIKSKGISFEFDTEIEEKIIACDPDVMERIILNLLSNALKFTQKGGKISIFIKDVKNAIIIEVQDTGIGIPKEKIKIIFERFRQVDKSFSRKHEGSGIGLSLVKSLVEMLGGQINVQSNLGKGSVFSVSLPQKLVEDKKESILNEDNNGVMEKVSVEFSDIYHQ